MPKVNTPDETIFTMLGQMIGSTVSVDTLRQLEYNPLSWNDSYALIFQNMYIQMIDASNLAVCIVEPRMEQVVTLFEDSCRLVHVISINYIKDYLSRIADFTIEQCRGQVQSIKKRRELCFQEFKPTYDYMKVSSVLSSVMVRLYVLADVAAYNFFYYSAHKEMPPVGVYTKLPNYWSVRDLFTNQAEAKNESYIRSKRAQSVSVIRKFNAPVTLQAPSSDSETSSSDDE